MSSGGRIAAPSSSASLVRYDNPILISTTKASGKTSKHAAHSAAAKSSQHTSSHATTACEDILNSILPPREWTSDSSLWVQYVSSTPATRSDILALEALLSQRLIASQARETGICPIREEYYSQCFDELIRQVTINCAERGLLLLRVRDQIRMTLNTYQLLYESAIAFGLRKSLNTQQIKIDQQTKSKQLEDQVAALNNQLKDWQHKCKTVEIDETSRASETANRHAEECEYLEKHNAGLAKELQQILTQTAQPQQQQQQQTSGQQTATA